MVFSNYFNLFRTKSGVTGRVRALSESFADLCGGYRSRLIGFAYFAASIILGVLASSYSRDEALEYWQRTFFPSQRVIRFALGSRGLIQASEGSLLERGLRSLPSSLDERGSLWISANPVWVVVFLSSKEDLAAQPAAYCMDLGDCKTVPKNWQPMGVGWRALDRVIDQIDDDLRLRKKVKMACPYKTRKDPREIIY